MKKWICLAVFAVTFALLAMFLMPSLSPVLEEASSIVDSTLHMRLVCRTDETVRIYYDNGTETHFDEDCVAEVSLKGNKAEQTLEFSIPTSGLAYLRFQMGDGKNIVFNISEIELTSFSHRRMIVAEEIERLFPDTNSIGSLAPHNGYASVKTVADNPYFANTEALELTEERSSVTLVVLGTAATLALLLTLLVWFLLNKNPVRDFVSVGIALVLVLVPLILGFVSPDTALPSTRKLFDYTAEKESAFSQLLRRSPVGDLYDTLRLHTMQISPDATVTVGADGYLFSDTELIDYKRSANFPKTRIDAIEDALNEMDIWCAEQGKSFYFLIIPNKSTVYSDLVPGNIKQRNRNSRLDQLYENLYKYTDVKVIETVEDLKEKSDKQLYWKLDSAMTAEGGKTLANLVLRAMSNDYEDLPLVDMDLYDAYTRESKLRTLAERINIADRETETAYSLSDDSALTVTSTGAAVTVSDALKQELTDLGTAYLLNQTSLVENAAAQTDLELYVMYDMAAAPMIPFLYDGFTKTRLEVTHLFDQNKVQQADIVLFAIDEAKLLSLMDYTD